MLHISGTWATKYVFALEIEVHECVGSSQHIGCLTDITGNTGKGGKNRVRVRLVTVLDAVWVKWVYSRGGVVAIKEIQIHCSSAGVYSSNIYT